MVGFFFLIFRVTDGAIYTNRSQIKETIRFGTFFFRLLRYSQGEENTM